MRFTLVMILLAPDGSIVGTFLSVHIRAPTLQQNRNRWSSTFLMSAWILKTL